MFVRCNLVLIVLFATCVLFQSCCIFKGAGNITVENIDLDEAFKKVYAATQQALASVDASQAFTVESIDLSFETTSTTSADAGAKLWVVSGKYSRSWSTTSKSTFTFSQDVGTKKAESIDKSVAAFVNQLTASLRAAAAVKNIGPFGLTEMEIEVDFSIKKSTEGGIEIELSPVTPSANASKEKEIAHSITLKLKKK